MQFPDDVLSIIREFSKPMTRADWKSIRPLPGHLLYDELYGVVYLGYKPKLKSLYEKVFDHLKKSEWGKLHIYIRAWGVCDATYRFGITTNDLYNITGMRYADEIYVRQNYFSAIENN